MPGVLYADLRGDRDEAVEIIAEPMLLKSYGIPLDQLIAVLQTRATAWSPPARSRANPAASPSRCRR